MLTWKTKTMVACLAVATLLQAFPQDADAFLFRWLRRRRAERIAYRTALYRAATCCQTNCNPCATTVNFAPSPCQPACQPVCAQRVCSYQPQVSYRTVYRQVPVTVYRPVTSVDPCTGCPVTTMRACTSMTTRAQRVPVTTYRQVCSMVTQPTQVVSASPVTSCPSCAVPQVAPAMPAPTTSVAPSTSLSPVPVPQTQQQQQGTTPAEQAPTLPQTIPGSQTPYSNGSAGTYQGSSNRSYSSSYQPRSTQPQSEIRPLPDLDQEDSRQAPPLLSPDDRTAARDVVPAGAFTPISWTASTADYEERQETPNVRRFDDSGWRPAG